MNEWQKVKLGKLGNTYTGLSGKTKDDFGQGKPFIIYTNIFNNGQIDPSKVGFVEIKNGETQNQVKFGDIFFTTSSETIEEVGMTSVLLDDIGETYLNSFCFGFRLHDFETLLPEFARYLFRGEKVRHSISLKGQGSTRFNLSKIELLNKLELNIPPKTEQTRIAEILGTADASIAETERLIAKYNRIKTGLMQDLLTRGIDAGGNIRSKSTHKFVIKNGIEVPEDWDVKPLNDCIDKSTIITYGIVQTGKNVPSGIRVLRTVDLKKDRIDTRNLLRTTKEISNSYSRTLLKENDIVCNVRASVGDFNIIPKKLEDCNLTRGVARISLNKKINPFFALWFLRSETNKRQMELLIKGTTFIDINIADLRTIKLPIPRSRLEQGKIALILETQIKTINSEKNKLEKLQKIKTGLMQDLLSGNKRVV